MAKDRAAPFSRKHRRYWIPVTGGMILIGVANLVVGMCSYTPAGPPPQPIKLVIPMRDAPLAPDASGTIGAGELPAAVIRAFAARYPRTISPGARVDGDTYIIQFPPGAPHRSATFRADGTFVSEQ